MRRRFPLIVAAVAAAGLVVGAPLAALAECSGSHVSVAKRETPPKVTEPAAVLAPAPDTTSLQVKVVEPPAERPTTTEAKPEVR